jgi:ATP-dependent DNA helicase RecG
MTDIKSLADIALLRESVDVECKLAGGRDGKGALPEDFWPTYSAFANTQGGVVVLGVREANEQFTVHGIVNVAKVRRELFDNLNNRQKVSVNLLSDADVAEVDLGGRTVLVVNVPRATRKQRPVFLTANPFSLHTYRRLNDGDRHLADEDVKRMIAEQVEDSRDDRILTGYDFDDLDSSTFRAYRQVFTNREPEHPWASADDRTFLRLVGGWRLDRESGRGGLTLAGLLMFGKMVAIQEELPNYMLDYQERPESKTEKRWIDRITLDGKWSGNLDDFYRKLYPKLTADLKVPFQLEKGERKDETPVHEALREALANVLVHADYSDRASVLVVKRPDMFGFRNPGLMRIPVETALQGGEPDCRNRTLHRMFRFVGVGEQAGTGIPKILHGWQSQHWNPPKLYDNSTPYNQTLLELRMIDLFPAAVMSGLAIRFGSDFGLLSHVERVALAVAASEGTVNHARLRSVTVEHPGDLSKALQRLTQLGMLASTGGRGAVYHLPGEPVPTPDDVFGPALGAASSRSKASRASSSDLTPGSSNLAGSSSNLSVSSSNLIASSSNLIASSSNLIASSSNLTTSSSNLTTSSSNLADPRESPGDARDAEGCLITDQLSRPVIDDLSALSSSLKESLERHAALPRAKRKVDRDALIDVVLTLCHGRFITLQCLAELVRRNPATLRNQYLTGLVRNRRLVLAFPTTPTHERQAYTTAEAIPT